MEAWVITNRVFVSSVFLVFFLLIGCSSDVSDDGKTVSGTVPLSNESPTETEVIEETPPAEPEKPMEENPTPEPTPEPVKTGETHYVDMIDGGFEKDKAVITIKVGDTVVWQNVREAVQFNKAMIIGTQKCSKVKSEVFVPGDSFKWTFMEPMTCTIVDGIYTTQSMKVIVE